LPSFPYDFLLFPPSYGFLSFLLSLLVRRIGDLPQQIFPPRTGTPDNLALRERLLLVLPFFGQRSDLTVFNLLIHPPPSEDLTSLPTRDRAVPVLLTALRFPQSLSFFLFPQTQLLFWQRFSAHSQSLDFHIGLNCWLALCRTVHFFFSLDEIVL